MLVTHLEHISSPVVRAGQPDPSGSGLSAEWVLPTSRTFPVVVRGTLRVTLERRSLCFFIGHFIFVCEGELGDYLVIIGGKFCFCCFCLILIEVIKLSNVHHFHHRTCL